MTQAAEREQVAPQRTPRRLPWQQIWATIVGCVILIAAANGWGVTG